MRPWTSAELAQLREQADLGAQALALLLDRPIWSIRRAAHRHRISLRPRGERRGHILGQPREGSWVDQLGADSSLLAEIREGALDGSVDVAVLEARILEARQRKPLCPSCGRRPWERKSTGLCEPCHVRELARAHRDEKDRREAKRDLWRARQEKHRAGDDE
jgi:hypothetical protein